MNMAVFFWYLVRSDLSSVRYSPRIYWTIDFLQGTRNTRPCKNGPSISYTNKIVSVGGRGGGRNVQKILTELTISLYFPREGLGKDTKKNKIKESRKKIFFFIGRAIKTGGGGVK